MEKKKWKIHISPLLIVLFAVLALYVLSLIGIFVWGICSTLVHPYAAKQPEVYGFPGVVYLHRYPQVFTANMTDAALPFWRILVNSLLYALGCAFFKTLIPCLTAYACARFNFKISKVVHTIILITMIVPIVGSLPSELKVAKFIGFHNSIWGLWVMSANMQGLYFFVMYSAFKAMPMGYTEAAKIDGANNLDVLVRIALPLIVNLFLTILLINFVEYWNNYQVPQVYLPDHPTLGYTLFYYVNGAGQNDVTFQDAKKLVLAFIIATPVLVLFLIFQERLMGNLTMGGLKG